MGRKAQAFIAVPCPAAAAAEAKIALCLDFEHSLRGLDEPVREIMHPLAQLPVHYLGALWSLRNA